MALIKILTTLFIQLEFWSSVKDLVLLPFSNPTLELALIMLVIPFFVNLLIFWVTDNFLMRHDHHTGKSFLINYVGKKSSSNGLNNSVTRLHGNFVNHLNTHIRNNYHLIRSNQSIMKSFDSEGDALISGDEHFGIDDVEMYDTRPLDS